MADINADTLLEALGLARRDASGPLGSVTVALVVGLVVGGVFGLFFAPKSGEETREELRKQASDAKESLLAAAKKIGKASDTDRSAPNSPPSQS
jgi:hypothetical protein